MSNKFQKIAALLLSGTIALSASGYSVFAQNAEPSENLVINGSFENPLGELGDTWDGYWSPAVVEIKAETTEYAAYDGEKYVEIRGRNAQAICLRQAVAMTAGIPYIVSAYLRIPESSGHEMKIYTGSKGEENVHDLVKASVDSTWTKLSAVYTPKNDGNYRFSFIDVTNTPSEVAPKYHFDNFVVTSDYINDAIITIDGDEEITAGTETVNISYGVTVKNGNKTISGSYSVHWLIDSASENGGASIDENTGELEIPSNFLGDSHERTIIVKAEVEDFGIIREVTKSVTVKEYLSPQERVENQLANMQDESFITSENKESVEGNLNLKTSGEYGTIIAWSSDEPEIINNEGKILAEDGKAHTVTLTATVSYTEDEDTYSDTKEFTVTTATKGENLINNGGFENQFADGRNSINRGETLGEWFANWVYASRDSVNPFRGNYSVKISERSAQYQGLEQEVSLKAGIPYTVSAYLRIPESTGHNMKIYTPVKGVEDKNDLVFVNVDGSWTKLSATFTPLSDGNFKFGFIDATTDDVVPIYYFDDFNVTSDYLKNALISIDGNDETFAGIGTASTSYSVIVKSGDNIINGSYSVNWSIDASSESDGASIGEDTGILAVPADFLGDSPEKTIILKAEVEDFGITREVTKIVTVKEYVPAQERVENQLANMQDESFITSENKESVEGNLNLKTSGEYGTIIAWSSDEPEIINNEGKILAEDGKAHTVTLTATVSYTEDEDTYSDTKEFTVTTATKGENLINNGGFENQFADGRNSINRGETLGEWFANWVYASRDSVNPFRGNYSVKISERSAQYQGLEQEVSLKAGIPYAVSAYLRIPESSGHEMKIYTSVKGVEDKNDLVVVNVDDSWTKLSATFTPVSDGNFKFRFIDVSTSDVVPQYYFDNFTVSSEYIKNSLVTVNGPEYLIMSATGNKTETYSASVKNSEGTEYTESYSIKWSLDTESVEKGAVINQDTGVVTIPEGFLGDSDSKSIVIKAEVEDFGFTKTAERTVEVKAYISPQEIISSELSALNESEDIIGGSKNSSIENITENLDLNRVGRYGASISWNSSDPEIITNDGELKTTDADWHKVILTATVSYGGISDTKSFNLIVSGRYNLVFNGDFEESFDSKNIIEKNTTNGPWYANWATAERVEGDAQSGTHYVKINGRTTRSQGLEQTVKLKAGKTYTISAWVRMPEGSEEHSLILSADNNGTAMANVLADANEWKQLTATKVCSADEDFTIKIFDSTNTYASSFYIDNYSITCSMMKSAEIVGYETMRKPLSGTKMRTYTVKALDTQGNEIEAPEIEWYAESIPSGVSLEGNTLSVSHNAESGEIMLYALVEYEGVILKAKKTVSISDYLDEQAIVSFAAKELEWDNLGGEQEKDNVTADINLPIIIPVTYNGEVYSVNVKWTSSDENVLKENGTVKRSPFKTVELILTGHITLGEEEETVSYKLTVPKLLNLADNPGFEDVGTKWIGGAISTEKAHTGSKSFYVEESYVTLENEFMRDGCIYYIEGYVLSESALELSLSEKTSGKKIIEGIKTGNGHWSLFNKDFVIKSDEKAYFEFAAESPYYLDDIVIRDITQEYNEALTLTIKAETAKSQTAVDSAKTVVKNLPDCDRKTALINRINAIKIKSTSPVGGGSGGGGGGGSKSYATPIVSNDSYNPSNGATPFADITGHWAENDVKFLFEKGIINGKSADSYAPEDKVTRAEFAALAVRLLNLKTRGNVTFSDVTSDKWYADAVTTAAAYSIINGDGGYFRPNNNVKREEAAVMIMRTYRAAGKKTEVSAAMFKDSTDISEWASQDIGYAAGLGVIKGMEDGCFIPKAELTRAQAATIIKRIFDLINN